LRYFWEQYWLYEKAGTYQSEGVDVISDRTMAAMWQTSSGFLSGTYTTFYYLDQKISPLSGRD